MKVDDIRGQLRRRGVSGLSAMRKPDLVKTLVRKLRSEQGGAARKSTGPAGRPSATKKTAAAKKTTAARRTAPSRAKAAPSAKATGARAKAAPAKKAAGARAKAAPAKKAAAARAAPAKKTTTARAKAAPAKKTTTARAKAAPAKKTTTARAKAAPAKKATTARAKAAPAKKTTTARAKAAPARGTAAAATQVRSGRSASRSVSSSQQIMSLDDRPERPGRSLVTTNHEVIQRWARARGAKPATIAGTERGDRPGVLTFNIPGYRESSRIREVSWDDWFRTFDLRGLNLIYQEQMRDGRQSNFFRTENPNREDA
ncbi:hypothetical protein [Micromonospora terminaliae]|nr:hypothetical protein [Micromonospora terminaliae]